MTNNTASNNKRIAKNTMILYIRTFITMLVGLYTSRVMLQALGVDNYGIQNVVGGIVGMSTLITGTMSIAISRYLTFELGRGNTKQLRITFSTSVNAQIIMSLIVCVLLELAGVWFLNSQASIPDGRMVATNWVLQCSIITLAINLVSSPYNALIIAHEHMSIYAYMSIVDVTLKLLICYIIAAYGGDRLILLAMLNVAVALCMRLCYSWYCSSKFEEAHYNHKYFDKRLLKELTSFSGWTFLNHGAWTFGTQGISMLVNVFFGVAYNASRGIAQSVNGAIQSFVGNFTTAFAPQITKSFAAGDLDYTTTLVNRGTKFTWLMMLVFIVPVCMEADTLLELWLGEVPPLAAIFLRFTMFETLAVSVGQNLHRLIIAEGHIKRYSIESGLYVGLVFPLTWILYSIDMPVWSAYIVFIFIFITLNVVRFACIKRFMTFSVKRHLKECWMPCLSVSVVSFSVPLLIELSMGHGILRFCTVTTAAVTWTVLCCIVLGLTQHERTFVLHKAYALWSHMHKSQRKD